MMDRGGGDQWGYGKDGFGAGRQGRGDGRTGARKNVWERIGKRAEDQPNRDLRDQLKEHHATEAVKQGEAEERREQHGKNDDQAKEK
jgi:hypothetical protein